MKCPVCQAEMRKLNHPRGARSGRSHSHYAQPQKWICPVAEAEVFTDVEGHFQKVKDALHAHPLRIFTEFDQPILVGHRLERA
jgi:hypothetical protein